ncbi:unnamed protein product [Polarella glacialis]|uniref:KH domain-containing protein n=1 Tax=Polarella glacialis TaxID=89957 RepID=A0A813HWV4_POLGL|nr:unnamed protein product [Polarella glacialis]
MKWLFQQLEGPVWVENWEDRDDITVLDIPSDCIGYVTGSRRAALGGMEEEWGTLMFFMTKPGSVVSDNKGRGKGFGEQLAILGPKRGRRGAELKVMSSVEEKANGQFTKGIRDKFTDEKGFGTDRFVFKEDELSYALGKLGSTRKKLAAASGCIIQYVGHVCFLAGELAERRRGKEFLDWLLQQRRGQVTVNNVAGRDDCTEVHVPENCKGWVTGNRGSELRRMELETGTYMFMALDKRGDERLLIFCVDPGAKMGDKGRAAAERLVNELVQDRLFVRLFGCLFVGLFVVVGVFVLLLLPLSLMLMLLSLLFLLLPTKPTSHPTDRPTNRPTDQPTNQPVVCILQFRSILW